MEFKIVWEIFNQNSLMDRRIKVGLISCMAQCGIFLIRSIFKCEQFLNKIILRKMVKSKIFKKLKIKLQTKDGLEPMRMFPQTIKWTGPFSPSSISSVLYFDILWHYATNKNIC